MIVGKFFNILKCFENNRKLEMLKKNVIERSPWK